MAIKLIPSEGHSASNSGCVQPLLGLTAGLSAKLKNSDMPLSVHSVLVKAQSESVLESHGSIEMWVVVRGEGVVCSDGNDYKAQEGDVFYFESFVNHKVINESDKSMLITSVWCDSP